MVNDFKTYFEIDKREINDHKSGELFKMYKTAICTSLLLHPTFHLLLNTTYSSTLPLTSFKSPIQSTVDPSGTIPTGINYSHPAPSPILTPIKTSTEYQSILLPTQLYTSIYFLCSRMPHMPYIPLCFPTPIMMQSHAPIHFSQKLIESLIVKYWHLVHTHYLHHTHTQTHP